MKMKYLAQLKRWKSAKVAIFPSLKDEYFIITFTEEIIIKNLPSLVPTQKNGVITYKHLHRVSPYPPPPNTLIFSINSSCIHRHHHQQQRRQRQRQPTQFCSSSSINTNTNTNTCRYLL
jgi:hypothetical protein